MRNRAMLGLTYAAGLRVSEVLTLRVTDYADVARLAPVSRARISRIIGLTLLAPGDQEARLFLPPADSQRGSACERTRRPIGPVPD